MPSYLIHSCAVLPRLRALHTDAEKKLFLLGTAAPDLWKHKPPSEKEYLKIVFSSCRPNTDSFTIPFTYKQLLLLCDPKHGGSHFGKSPTDTGNADFTAVSRWFVTHKLRPSNLFFRGFIQHLIVDKEFYTASVYDRDTFKKDLMQDRDQALDTLHSDWNKINDAIMSWYPEMREILPLLPPKAKNIIQFEKGNTKYVYQEDVHQFIEKMHKELEKLTMAFFDKHPAH